MSPDISMCSPEKFIKICKKCYRKTAKPEPQWQSYAKFKPNKDGTCDHFMREK